MLTDLKIDHKELGYWGMDKITDKSKTLHTRYIRCSCYVRVVTVWARLCVLCCCTPLFNLSVRCPLYHIAKTVLITTTTITNVILWDLRLPPRNRQDLCHSALLHSD
jgi:hypothetical protein